MGAWKATQLVLLIAVVWCCLWGFHALLSRCRALGPLHRRYVALPAGQQRNVCVYLTHLLLDTAMLVYCAQPLVELWLGLTETVAEARAGVWGFTYLVACYALELTWRRSIDTMLAIHHISTITVITLFSGEFTVSWLVQDLPSAATAASRPSMTAAAAVTACQQGVQPGVCLQSGL